MDTAAKERLTGALLVVLALVVVVPPLLSGDESAVRTAPAHNPEEGAPLQTFDVPLDGSSTLAVVPREMPATAAAESVAVPPPVTEVKAPQPEAPAAASAAEKPAATVAEQPAPAVDRKPQEKITSVDPPAPAVAKGRWWVQLGSFASRDNAEQLGRKLRAGGFAIDVSRVRAEGKELYRVRAGPVADRSAAVALQARLEAAGQKKSSLVAP